MEPAGVLELDLQFGFVRQDEPWRASAPDFEVDLGLAPGLELDIDGAYHIDTSAEGTWDDGQSSFDNLWIASKVGLYDERKPETRRAWALGVQLGPKLPVAAGAHGAGYEAIALIAETWQRSQIVLNAGGFIDPGDGAPRPRPRALEGGIDLTFDTPVKNVTLTGELGGVHFFSADKDQLHGTLGLSWALDNVDLSVVGLVGLLSGVDRGGVLLGIAPRCRLWPDP